MTKIVITKEIGNKDANLLKDAEILYSKLITYIEENKAVTIDFSEIEVITASFLNIFIGQLYSRYNSNFLKDKIKIKGISEMDLETLRRVVENAKNYFKNRTD